MLENSVLRILSKLFGFLTLKFSVRILSVKCLDFSSLENCSTFDAYQTSAAHFKNTFCGIS